MWLIAFLATLTSCGDAAVPSPSPGTGAPAPLATAAASPTPPTNEPSLVTVAFRDRNVGLVAGVGTIERTEDGGAHWSRVASVASTIWQIRWFSLDTVVAASDQGLLTSADAGLSWRQGRARDALVDVWMLSPVTGFAVVGHVRTDNLWLPLNQGVAGRELVRTQDSGDNWTAVDTGLPVVQSVWFVNDHLGWVAGPTGIANTKDGGRTWLLQLHPSDQSYTGWGAQVTFVDDQHGFALYRTQDTSMSRSGKDVYFTDDGGGHWNLESASEQRAWAPDATPNGGGGADGGLVMLSANAAAFLSAGVAITATYVANTTDRGRTWTYRLLPYGRSGVGQLSVQGDVLWAVLNDGNRASPPSPSVLLRSLDRGASWQAVR
jgi:photosystem II stability/assembly factor-like uncharacterized protein